MKSLFASIFFILAASLLLSTVGSSLFVSASNPKHLFRSLKKEGGTSKSSSTKPFNMNQWNFLKPSMLGSGKGGDCAACTLIVGLLMQVEQINSNNDTAVIAGMCGEMTNKIERDICTDAMKVLLPIIKIYTGLGETADTACQSLKMCAATPAGMPICHLFPLKNRLTGEPINPTKNGAALRQRYEPLFKDVRSFNICTILPQVCDIENHLPAADTDGDTFSYSQKTLRGSYWRGTDANDLDATVHPGRSSFDETEDTNCNGISGTDPSDGVSYEEKFCKGTGEMGIAILGDSATAHFSIPPQWLNATTFQYNYWHNFVRDAENELDWPMLSWSTGFLETSDFPHFNEVEHNVPCKSVYKALKETNLCNNNDFQNLGVNGARSHELLDFAKLLGRTNDGRGSGNNKPLMLFHAMIGNDVCNSNPDVSSMTTAQEFYNNYLQAVLYADSILPPGSHQVLVGLARGTILYDAMSQRIHPIGAVNLDVTYEDVYNFLNCLHLSPCAGWMQSNRTIREATQAHADLLSSQLPLVQAAVQGQLKNSAVHFILNWTEVLFEQTQYPMYECIEKSDGFHPSQVGNMLIAEFMVNKSKELGFWPKPNPNNALIRQQFPNVMNDWLLQ